MGNPGQATATVANGVVTGVTVSNPGFELYFELIFFASVSNMHGF
jgi:hypothetical protein